jgi:hypothetical protein
MFDFLLQLVFGYRRFGSPREQSLSERCPTTGGRGWDASRAAGFGARHVCITALAGASLVLTVALYILTTTAVAGLGILRRRRFGVVAFVCIYLLLLLVSSRAISHMAPGQPYLITVRKKPLTGFVPRISFPKVIAIVPTAVYLVCTVIYFKRRWSSMNDESIPGDLRQRAWQNRR